MANQGQQIATTVKRCCDDEASFQEYSLNIVTYVKANMSNKDAAKPVVDAIKQVIKDRKADSPSKVLSLRLLHLCVTQGGGSEELILYMEKKIMSRLSTLAKYKKESSDLEKGVLLFGKTTNQKASADFLKLLLLYLQQWATRYPQYSPAVSGMAGKQTEIAKIYQMLVKEKIHFPSEESVMQSLGGDYSQSMLGDTQYNPTSTAPQSLNQSLNRGQFSTYQQPPSALNMSSATLGRQSVVNSSQLDMSVRSPPQSAQLSREQQVEIANKIKGDYKKLNEYQATAKLVQEVMSMPGDGHVDDDLLVQFRTQLIEGKDFAEGFLKTIIETPFTIRDRDTKIEKILGIIGEIEAQLSKILAKKPLPPSSQKEEVKVIDFTETPAQNKRASEVKGILKTPAPQKQQQQFQTHKVEPPLQSARESVFPSDFKLDQTAFKTNFAPPFNPNATLDPKQKEPNVFDNQEWAQSEFSMDPPKNGFMDFEGFKPPQTPAQSDPFDFGVAFQQAPSMSNMDEFKWDNSEPQNDQPNVNLPADMKPHSSKNALVNKKLSIVKMPSQMSHKSKDSDPDNFGVIKNVTQHQPQISHRSPDSHPASDGDDGGHLSSSNEKHEFNVPASINESQMLRQSVAGRGAQQPDWFSGNESPKPNAIVKQKSASRIPDSLVQRNSVTGKGNQSSKSKQAVFEKFDFNEVQQTQKSSRESHRQVQAPESTADCLQHLDTISSLESKVKQLSSTNDSLQQEMRSLKQYEYLYEEERLAKTQLDQQLRALQVKTDEFKKSAERMEHKVNKLQKEREAAQGKVLELEGEVAQLGRDMEDLRMSEGDTKKQLQGELMESRKREEELRVMYQTETQEGRKRESYMKEQWLRDLQDKEKSEEEWERRCTEVQAKMDGVLAQAKAEAAEEVTLLRGLLRERDDEIERLKKQLALKAEVQQQLKIKTTQIKFNNNAGLKGSSSTSVTPKVVVVAPAQVESNAFDFAFPSAEPKCEPEVVQVSPPHAEQLFTSVIKPLVQNPIPAHVEIRRFEPEEEELKIEQAVYEDTMGNVPSGDSDSDHTPKVVTPKAISPLATPPKAISPVNFSPKDKLVTAMKVVPEQIEKDPFDFSDVLKDIVQPPPKSEEKFVPPKGNFDFSAVIEEESSVPESSIPEEPIHNNIVEEPIKVEEVPVIIEPLVPVVVQEAVIAPKQEEVKSDFNIDELLKGIVEEKKVEEPLRIVAPRKESDPFADLVQQKPVVQQSQFMTAAPQQQQNVVIDKQQFSTVTEAKQNELGQSIMQHALAQFFKKSLLSNKAVLFEDANVQIGIVADFQPGGLVRMRLFFGNKHQPVVNGIGFIQAQKGMVTGQQVVQSREGIPQLQQGQQEPIDINIQYETHLITTPVYNLTYRQPSGAAANIPVRLPVVLLKFCVALPQLDTMPMFIQRWQSLPPASEIRSSFSIDFGTCRSLSQLKDTLRLGRNCMSFVEQTAPTDPKNVVCGGTLFQRRIPIFALIRVSLTADGHGCELVARSPEPDFTRLIVQSVLELVAVNKY